LGEQSVSLDQQYYRDAHLFVHLRHEVVMLDGQAITLARMQHRLLALLVQHAGEVVPLAILLIQIRWLWA
jgi:DNA-binding response OmpR family regulator